MKQELSIQETQAISLEILKKITDVCEQINARYYLIYGTLIGAVRHQGFIPWDDDVDIMMPRPDYERLLKYLEEHIEEYKYLKIFNPTTSKEYPYMITRISDDRYRIEMENEANYGMGVFVYIYPFDGLGDTEKEAYRFGMKGDRLSSLCYQATRKRCAIETTTSKFRKVIKFPVYIFAKICGKNVFQNRLEKLANVKSYDESEYVGCVIWLSGGIKDMYKREWFDESEMHDFGKYQFRIPKNYDKILKHIYGDYMQLPPEEERVGHHAYKVYKK